MLDGIKKNMFPSAFYKMWAVTSGAYMMAGRCPCCGSQTCPVGIGAAVLVGGGVVGVVYSIGAIKKRLENLRRSKVDPVKIKEGIYSSGEIVGKYDGKDMPEQAVVLETSKGLVVIAGCAHPGPGITEMVAPLHCTGAKAAGVFQQAFASECFLFREGQEISL
jgi:metal-dependent hydrolase (beta-lactamase superfamily II)